MLFFRIENQAQQCDTWSSHSYTGTRGPWQEKDAEAADIHQPNKYLLSTHYVLKIVLSIGIWYEQKCIPLLNTNK